MGVKAHSREYMKTVGGKYWRNSLDPKWAEAAKKSYERISKQYEPSVAKKLG